MNQRSSTTGTLPAWAPSLLVVFAVCQIGQACQEAAKSDSASHPQPKAAPAAKTAAVAAPAPVLTATVARDEAPSSESPARTEGDAPIDERKPVVKLELEPPALERLLATRR